MPLIEDAACALGSEVCVGGVWSRVGAPHGDVATFSFHPRKVITTGEGGALTCRDAAVDAEVRRLRQHGRAPGAAEHTAVGFNYRMTDIQAAIGRAQLTRLDEIVARRRVLAARYAAGLAGAVELPVEPDWARSNWQSYQVLLPDSADRDAVAADLKARGVDTRPGVECAHLEPAYAAEPDGWRAADALEVSETRRRRALILPLFPQLTDADQDRVIATLREAL